VRELTAVAHENAKAINAATLFELDDVIDPAETRGLIASTLAAAASTDRPGGPARFVDTW
jgi:methylmalonyl-CoA carboxyltransferase 12S subunit